MWPASGRTDAGVHALGQVAAFTIGNPIPLPNLRRAINRLLPPAIRVLSAEEVPAEFHPRFDAKGKTYEYRIVREEVCSPFEWPYAHHYPYPLDEDRMARLARVFEGEHDFTAFAASDDRDAEGKSKVRTVFCFGAGARRRAPDLPREGQRLSEAHGEEPGWNADRGGQGEYRESGRATWKERADRTGQGAVSGECGILRLGPPAARMRAGHAEENPQHGPTRCHADEKRSQAHSSDDNRFQHRPDRDRLHDYFGHPRPLTESDSALRRLVTMAGVWPPLGTNHTTTRRMSSSLPDPDARTEAPQKPDSKLMPF